jgi:hypothetical protein
MGSRSFLFLLLLLLLPLASVLAAEEEVYKPGTDVLLLNEEEFKVGGCLGGRVLPSFPLHWIMWPCGISHEWCKPGPGPTNMAFLYPVYECLINRWTY